MLLTFDGGHHIMRFRGPCEVNGIHYDMFGEFDEEPNNDEQIRCLDKDLRSKDMTVGELVKSYDKDRVECRKETGGPLIM